MAQMQAPVHVRVRECYDEFLVGTGPWLLGCVCLVDALVAPLFLDIALDFLQKLHFERSLPLNARLSNGMFLG